MKNVLTYLVLITLLSGCAWANRYRGAATDDYGTVEFVNASPAYRVNITLFEDATDCRGTKFISVFESTAGKSVTVDHREKLAISLGVSVQADLSVFSGCGGIYALPFSSGDRRITLAYFPEVGECRFLFESNERGNWQVINGVEEREPRQPFLQSGAFCSLES